MVEIKDIVDRESLEAWLKDKPQKASQIIVHRSAMRVLLEYWHFTITSQWAEEGGISILPVLRANLTSEIVAYRASGEIPRKLKSAASESGNNAQSVGKFADSLMEKFSHPDNAFSYSNFLFSSEHGASSAEFAVNSVLATRPFMKMYAANSDPIYNDIWKQLRSDISNFNPRFSQNKAALWLPGRNPFSERWLKIKRLCANASIDWSFWIKWYEAALNGEPLDYKMLEQIALIPSDDWEQGPAHVNAIISKIETEFELKVKISDLEGKLLQISSSGRGIGDNQGPPMADEPVAKELMVIWEPLQELKDEIEEKHPNRERLLAIARKIGDLSAAIFKWAAGLANFALKTYIGVAAAKLATVADPVATILSTIYDLIVKLVGYLP